MGTAPAFVEETSPVVPTVAIDGMLLLHTPPGLASDSAVAWPWHIVPAPVIAAGTGYTVTTAVA